MRRRPLIFGFALAHMAITTARANFCAVDLADYFRRPTRARLMNRDAGSKQKRVLLAKFPVDRHNEAAVWLVEETFPFLPGLVSKRVYRDVTAVDYRSQGKSPRPLTYREFSGLVSPHAQMVETKERAVRRWTNEIYDALSEVTLRFGPDMVTNWIEDENTHQIVSTLRLTNLPYSVGEDGQLVGAGATVTELYGEVNGFRNPFGADFDPDAKWEKILPPNINPLEHVLKVDIRRTGYLFRPTADAVGLDSEVGAYAVEETYPEDIRTAAILEMWLQMTRASTRFSQYGNDFLNLGLRTLTYGDPYSQRVFRAQHGIRAQSGLVIPRPGTVMEETGEIPYANAKWRVIGWTGADLIKENQRILNGEHPRFTVEQSKTRRISLFVPTRDYDTGVLGAFDVIFDLLGSKDDTSFIAALSNLIYNLQILEKEPDGEARLKKLAPRIQAVFDKALLGSVRHRAVFAIDSFDFLVKGMKYFILPPKTVPKWVVRALQGKYLNGPKQRAEKMWLQELAITALYNYATSDRLDWNPDKATPPHPRFAEFEKGPARFSFGDAPTGRRRSLL